MCDEDYVHTQCKLLNDQLTAVEFAGSAGCLSELIYTASETGILDCGISFEDALTVWKIVELAKSLGDNCPQELRM